MSGGTGERVGEVAPSEKEEGWGVTGDEDIVGVVEGIDSGEGREIGEAGRVGSVMGGGEDMEEVGESFKEVVE